MIREDPALSERERAAVERLLRRLLRRTESQLLQMVLFGSRARGDVRTGSDIDLLLLACAPPTERGRIAALDAADACTLAAATGTPLETWTVTTADLRAGRRTPMLVDALADGRTLWPPGRPTPRLPFTPADARFCAGRLLEWVFAGGPLVRAALARDEPWAAAARARDDIARLATAALLLTGDTRHRRSGSLRRFERRFVRTGLFSPWLSPALRWAETAYPPGRLGRSQPPPTPLAVATAPAGFRLAARMQNEVVPWVLDRMADLPEARHRQCVRLDSSVDSSSSGVGRAGVSTRNSPICCAMNT